MADRREIISYGPTLARRMSNVEVMARLSMMDGNRVLGIAHVTITPTTHPRIVNVDCWLENDTPPEMAAKALHVAEARLRKLHNIDGAGLVLVDINREAHRHRAERLVDMICASHIGGSGKRPKITAFDHTRENCIRAIMGALASKD